LAVRVTAEDEGDISGHKFRDSNGNGQWDENEPPIEGWNIRLLNDGQVVESVYTDDDGVYSFTGLRPGAYIIEEEQRPEWEQTRPDDPDYYTVTIDPNGIEWTGTVDGVVYGGPNSFYYTKPLICGGDSTVIIEVYGVTPGEYTFICSSEVYNEKRTFTEDDFIGPTITVVDEFGAPNDLDFGNYQQPPETSISGRKYYDANKNGRYDEGESYLKGWTIELSNGQTDVTDDNGYYEFAGLEYGEYRVKEVLKSGWKQTAPNDPNYHDVVLDEQNKIKDNLDFGNYKPSGGGDDYGSISGYKFNDLDGDGAWADNEPALSGWTITLDDGQTTTTDANGYYIFNRLPFGSYTVEEVQQDDWTQTAPATGSHTIEINSGNRNARNLNFGNQEDSIIIPPVSGPPEEEPVIIVYPTAVPAGDPTITVKTGPDAKQVYAVLPDGRKLNLKQGEPGIWKVSFLVPFGTPDGPYNIQVYVAGANGETWQCSYKITIDNSLPLMKINPSAQADCTYMLKIKPLFNAVSIRYSVPGHGDTLLTRTPGSSWWTAAVPAGDGVITAVDESGYEVVKSMFLTILKPVGEPPVVQVVPALSQAAHEMNANQESTEAANGNYGLYVVIAALIVAAGVLVTRRIKFRD